MNIMTRNDGEVIYQKKQQNSTFGLFSMITVPDELGTETDEFLHQRLTKRKRKREASINKGKNSTAKSKKKRKTIKN
jgi:hypothetical protein